MNQNFSLVERIWMKFLKFSTVKIIFTNFPQKFPCSRISPIYLLSEVWCTEKDEVCDDSERKKIEIEDKQTGESEEEEQKQLSGSQESAGENIRDDVDRKTFVPIVAP